MRLRRATVVAITALAASGCIGPAQPSAAPSKPPATLNAAQRATTELCTKALEPLSAAIGSPGPAASTHQVIPVLSGADTLTGVSCVDALALPPGESGQSSKHAAIVETYVQPVTGAVRADALYKAFYGLCRAGREDLPQPLDGHDAPSTTTAGLSFYDWPQSATPMHLPRCYFYRSSKVLLHVKVTVLYPKPVNPQAADLKRSSDSSDTYARRLVELASSI